MITKRDYLLELAKDLNYASMIEVPEIENSTNL